MLNKSQVVLKLLLKIPKGKITSYGALARVAGTSPRAVGQIMRNNKCPEKYKCYKVIKSDGSIGGYAGVKNGKKIQRKIRLLKKNGIKVEKGKINLKKYLHRF